jgi:hypothetical protein
VGQARSASHAHLACTFDTVTDYWGCPKCGNLTMRFEDKDGRVNVATCEYEKCDYFDEGVPE